MGRQKRGWSQKELAKKVNEKKSLIANIERGKMRPDYKVIRKLEKWLDIELEEEVPATESQTAGRSGPLTIGDLILMAKKKHSEK